MSEFGVGIHLTVVCWFITFLLLWVSARTGHWIGKVALIFTICLSVLLFAVPNAQDKSEPTTSCVERNSDYSVLWRAVLLLLILASVTVGGVVYLSHVCFAPVQTRYVRAIGSL